MGFWTSANILALLYTKIRAPSCIETSWRWKFEFDNLVFFSKLDRGSPDPLSQFDACQKLVYIESGERTQKCHVCNNYGQALECHEWSFVTLAKVIGFFPFLNFEWVQTSWLLYTKMGIPPCIKASLKHIICNNIDLFDF